jgi:hypothetical protein
MVPVDIASYARQARTDHDVYMNPPPRSPTETTPLVPVQGVVPGSRPTVDESPPSIVDESSPSIVDESSPSIEDESSPSIVVESSVDESSAASIERMQRPITPHKRLGMANQESPPVTVVVWNGGKWLWGMDASPTAHVVTQGIAAAAGVDSPLTTLPATCIIRLISARVSLLASVARVGRLVAWERVMGTINHPADTATELRSWKSFATAGVYESLVLEHADHRDLDRGQRDRLAALVTRLWMSSCSQRYGSCIEHDGDRLAWMTLEARLISLRQISRCRMVDNTRSHLLTSLASDWHASVVAHGSTVVGREWEPPVVYPPDKREGRAAPPARKHIRTQCPETMGVNGILRRTWVTWYLPPESTTLWVVPALRAAAAKGLVVHDEHPHTADPIRWWCRASHWVSWSATWVGARVIPARVASGEADRAAVAMSDFLWSADPSGCRGLVAEWAGVMRVVRS